MATTQFLISNQTSTTLYASDGTRYATLPPFSINTAILVKSAAATFIAASKTATTGTPLSSTTNYMMIQPTVTSDSPVYACVNAKVTEVSRDSFPHVAITAVADSTLPIAGTACAAGSGGAWNFDVATDRTTEGFTDARLVVEPAGGGGDPPVDDGWSTTTWVLVIGGVLLLLLVLGLIIYFATRKKPPATVTVATKK